MIWLALLALTGTSTPSPERVAPAVDPVPDSPPPVTRGYAIDPVRDGALLGAASGFAVLTEAILSTGEIRPQSPGDPSLLLALDRPTALASHPEATGKILSDLSVGLAIGYCLLDIVRAEITDQPEGAFGYSVLYLETAAINIAIGDLVKIAVRRPRPRAYIAIREGRPLDATDLSLSFYSLHTALTAGFGATATHLAFSRNPDGAEGWILMGATIALTGFVGVQRVRDRAHFTTDVIAGALAGAGIGVLVPALHHLDPMKKLAVSPVGPDGPGLSVFGQF